MNKEFIKILRFNFSAYGYTILICFFLGLPMLLFGFSYDLMASILTAILVFFNVWFFFILPDMMQKNQEYKELMQFHTARGTDLKGCIPIMGKGPDVFLNITTRRLISLRGSVNKFSSGNFNTTESINRINGPIVDVEDKSKQFLMSEQALTYAKIN